jgi:hypothetical protein
MNITSNTADFKWEVVNGAIGYKLMYKTVSDLEWNVINSDLNHQTVTGLTSNTEYVWKVKAVCSLSPLITSDGSVPARFATAPLKAGANDETVFQLYPNPLSQSATIAFSLAQPSPVVIAIMDANGKVLRYSC